MAEDPRKKEELLTATAAGKPVQDRVATVQAARSIYRKLHDANSADAYRRDRIKGQVDGKPPWDPDLLAEKGLGYITNVNFLELRAVLDDRAGRRFSSYYEVPALVRVRQNFKYDQTKPQLPFSSVIEEEFTRLLKEDWSGFYPLLDLVGREADSYGYGVALFPDEWDWRPKAFHTSMFMPDPSAGLDPERLPLFCLHDKLTAGELFRYIDDEDLAKDSGWNVSAIRRLLVDVYVSGEKQDDGRGDLQGTAWESLEQHYRNNDFFYQSREFDPIEIVHIVYQQVGSRRVAHKMFPRLERPENDAFIFSDPERYGSMSQALWLLPYNYGDGYLKSCRGIASYMEQHCDMSNRFLGRAMDAGMTAASLLVQPTSSMAKDKLQVVRAGILTVIDPGLQMQQQNFSPRIGDILTLRRVSSDLVQNNTRESKDYAEDPAANQQPVSAAEIQDKASRASRGENQQTVFYSKHLQVLYREMFRRITNPDMVLSETDYPGKDYALVFIRRCAERGVPVELLLDLDNWRIMAVKPIGGGSPQARQQALTNMMQVRNEYDERGRKELIREYTAAQTSYEELDRFAPLQNRDEIGSNEHSIAALENASFGSGIQIPAGSDQVHVIHFKSHSQQILQMLQAIEEQGPQAVDPQRGMLYIGAALPNMEQHLQYLQLEPTRKAFVQEGVKILRQASALYDQFKAAVEKAQQEQAKLEQEREEQLQDSERRALTAEQQVELAKAEMKTQVDALKVQSLNAMRAQKTAEQLRVNADRAANELRLKAERQAADIEMDRAKAEADIDIKRRKSDSGGPPKK